MQKKFALYLVLSLAFSTLLATSLAARQTPQTWVTYTPPSGKFTAQFPAEPKPDHQTTKSGNLTSEVYTYAWADKGVVLIASYMDLDANATPSADEDLKAAQDSLVQGVGGKLLKSTRTEFPRGPNELLPTVQFTGESNTATIRGAVIYDAFHIYMLLTLCPKDQQCDATTAKFLITFRLNPISPSKVTPVPAPAPVSHSAQPAAQQASEPWLRFISDEGRFSALYPTQPKPDHKTTQSGDQTIESTTFLVVDNGIVLGTSYTDYDPKTTYDVEPGLIAEQNAFLKAVSATLLTSKRTEFPRGTEKLPAMEFTGASSEQAVKGWVIVDVRRVYIVVVLCPKTQDGAAETAKFFSSFKLTP